MAVEKEAMLYMNDSIQPGSLVAELVPAAAAANVEHTTISKPTIMTGERKF
jgi:hypothetical protein